MNRRNRFSPPWSRNGWEQVCGLLEVCSFAHKIFKDRNLKLVEIGSALGESACVFASYGIFNKVYAVDIWEDIVVYNIFMQNSIIYPDIISPIKSTSANAIASWGNGNVDMIYIDACHDYEFVLEDIANWSKIVRPGGIIAGHDYSESRWPGVYNAVNEYFRDRSISTFRDTSWAVVVD